MRENETGLQQDENLRTAADRVREELADAERNDVDARYAVARICADVKGQYGRDGLTYLETELGLAPSTLYRYVKVPEAWAPEAFKTVATRLNSKNVPLTWSHWELLASIKEGRRRKALLERTLKECLNVRSLRSVVQEAATKGRANHDDDSAAHVATRTFTRLLSSLEKEAAEIEKCVLDQTADTDARPTGAELSRLKAISMQIDAAIKTLDTLATTVNAVTARAEFLAAPGGINKEVPLDCARAASAL